jgi:hypothetical protein
VGLFTAARAVSNFRHCAPVFIRLLPLIPCPTSAPFQVRHHPICPVMTSWRLSAGSLCFLRHLVLLGICASLAVGLLTERANALIPLSDPMRISTFRAGEMRLGWVLSIRRGLVSTRGAI